MQDYLERSEQKYSTKELALVEYFSYSGIANYIAPHAMYRMMAEKAFITRDESAYADSVRRCLIAFNRSEIDPPIYRMTPEWEALIELSIEGD